MTANAGDPITAISVETPISATNPTLQPTVSPFATSFTSDAGQSFGGFVVVPGTGGTIVAGGTFTSQGTFTDVTAQSWTGTVNYGDGTATSPLTINPITVTPGTDDDYTNITSATYNLSHVFAQAGTYTVVISITDDTGQTETSSFTVTVVPAPPTVSDGDFAIAPAANPTDISDPTIINEDQSVVLTGKFTDVNPSASVTARVIWGDNSVTPATISPTSTPGVFAIGATHLYLAPGTLGSSAGVYKVEVQVSSTVNGATSTASTTSGLFYVQVDDVPPTNLQISTGTGSISEGGSVSLGGSFQAPGPEDLHVVTISWGDGSKPQTLTLGPGVTTFSGYSHVYATYNAASPGSADTILVSVSDLYEPLAVATASTPIVVNPSPVTGVTLKTTPATITEGSSIQLSGSFTSPGLDPHTVTINWGDNSPNTTVSLGVGVDMFSTPLHIYQANSVSQPGGAYKITATFTDTGLTNGPATTASTSIVVGDIASSVSNLVVVNAAQPSLGAVTQVNAGTTVNLTGNFSTPNPTDTYTVSIAWGDGTVTNNAKVYIAANPAKNLSSFAATHLYVDSKMGQSSTTYHIVVTVTDLEHTAGTGTTPITVEHVAPVDNLRSDGFNSSGGQVLMAKVTGGDTEPITSYSWTLNGATQPAGPTLPIPTTPGNYTVTSTVTDSYGVSSSFTAGVDVINQSTPTVYQVPTPTSGASVVLVSDLAGSHIIAAGTVQTNANGGLVMSGDVPVVSNPLTVPIIFDGAGTDETYVGDNANDVFYLHTDGSVAYGEGGNNVFEMTPNCTLAAAVNAGQNTLDFSSSTYGVTFDLTQTQGQVQDVDPVAQPGQHFVSVDATGSGTFSTLVESSGGGDTITAASNTTIVGMGGSDSVNIASTATNSVGNVNITGAADGDALVATGPTIGSINFQGDAGADSLINNGTINGTVVFSGGSDAGALTNNGSILGSVTYSSGSDGSAFNNYGVVTGSVNYTGGADTSTFTNATNASIGSITYTSGSDTGSLINMGTVGSITYDGGSDANALVNAETITNTAGATVGSITYNGGSDAGALVNNGTVTGSVNYGGGSDADTFTNNSRVNGSVTYTGGSDAGAFTNNGTVTGTVIYTSGSDAGTLISTGPGSGSIAYGGGGSGGSSDADTFLNNGTLGAVVYNGGSDATSFTNATGAVVGSITYTGGSDADTILNQGTVGSVTYNGGSDAGAFTNSGTITGTINYTGGSDADVLTNSPGGVVGSIVYTGGSDAGTIVNNGTVIGSITYGGGSDADALVNTGVVGTSGSIGTGNVTYNGGSDAGTFTNTGTITGTVTYNGGSDADSFTNQGSIVAVTYNGGSDAGTLTNSGTITGTLNYNGGSDADVLTNAPTGNVLGTLNFQGDTGADQLVNLGTLANVTFTGGSDSDALLNPGIVTGSIIFKGDAGADTLDNGATVNGVLTPGTVGSIVYTAGSDSDTLINPGTVNGSIVFTGDSNGILSAGSMTLENFGQAPSIAFTGDAAPDQLLNAQGSTVGSITYSGGSDTNLLVNQESGVTSITYNAGGDANVLNNSGSNFASIIFNAGSDTGANTLVNTGTGSPSSTITYNGGEDTGTLINTGSGLGSINYNGDLGSAALINEGSEIGTITFVAGSDGGALVNSGSQVSTITYTGGSDGNVFANFGTGIGTINYNGDQGSGYFQNNGSVTSINYNAGSDTDTLVNSGTVGSSAGGGINFTGDTGADALVNTSTGTIVNLTYTGGSDAETLINFGTLTTGAINLQGDTGANQLINEAGGVATGVTYTGGSDTDSFVNYGSLSNATYDGDLGVGTMYLDGAVNQGITYNGGSNGDELLIGPGALAVANIMFVGSSTNTGIDLLANEANGDGGITFQAGSGTANFWNFANNSSGLTFDGGSGTDSFDNMGTGVTGVDFDASLASGTESLYNSGKGAGTITFQGGSGTNTLTNTANNATSITYDGGTNSDTLTNSGNGIGSITFNAGSGTASLSNTGTSIGSITIDGGSGVDSLTNSGTVVGAISFTGSGSSSSFTDSAAAGSVVYNVSGPYASLIYSATGGTGSTVSYTGSGGGNMFVDSGSAGSMNVNLGTGDNQALVMTGASGNITIVGGDGNNTYTFSGTPTANVTLNQALFSDDGSIQTVNGQSTFVANPDATGGNNTIDFSSYMGGGVALDLMNTSPQAMPGGLTVTLTDPEGFETAIGTQYTNQIYGNLRPDTISTTALPDPRVDSVENQASPLTTWTADARTQWVYLDFDTYTVPGDYVYTTADRASVLQRMQLNYYGPDPNNPGLPDFNNRWFDVDITDNLSNIPSNLISSAQYATIYFNDTPPSGQPGGQSSQIDLGNRNLGGYAQVQVNGMVGGIDEPAATSTNIDLLSAKIGSHELGHLMGIRHSDAFGPIGFGINNPPGASAFNPTYDGPDSAFETDDHIISSPATVGTSRFNDLRDLDFGPREALKLAFASQGTTIVAPTGTQSTMANAMPITLAPITVPNTDVNLPDVEYGMNFDVAALDVEGTIGLNPTTGLAAPDYYALSGQKGDIDTFEVDSQELGRLNGQDTIDSVLTVYNATGQVVAYNDDQEEGTDSLIMDFTLPVSGTYYIKVSSFAATLGDPEYEADNPSSPLNPNNLQSILNPLNPDFSQSALTAFLDAKAGTATGQYDLFVYRFGVVDPTTANVDNTLVSRSAGTTLSGVTGTDTLMGPAGTLYNDLDQGAASAITVGATAPSPTIDLNTPLQDAVYLTGPTGSNPWSVTIAYGDGSSPAEETLPAGSSIPLSHQYRAIGSYTVDVTIVTGEGTFGSTVPVTVVTNQSPAVSITAPMSGSQFSGTAPVTFSASIANPYTGINYQATWTFTDLAKPSLTYTKTQTFSTATSTPSLAFSTSETFSVGGDYSVQLTVENENNQKSTTVPGSGSSLIITVSQAITTKTTVTAPNETFNGSPYALATAKVVGSDKSTLATSDLAFVYYDGTDTNLTTPLRSAPTSAGSYLVVAEFAGEDSYSPSTSAAVKFTIAQAKPIISLADAGGTYTGSPFAASALITGLSESFDTTLETVGLALTYVAKATGVASTSAPTTPGTYTVDADFAGSSDYLPETATANFTIGKAKPTVSISDRGGTFTGSTFPATATVLGVTGPAGPSLEGFTPSLTYYSGSKALSGAPSAVGSYSVIASFPGSMDYAAATATATFKIAKATSSVAVVDSGGTYTGSTFPAIATVNGAIPPSGSVTFTYYAGPTTKGTQQSGAPTTVGTYTVVATYNATDFVGTATSTFTITKAKPTISVSDNGGTYNGSTFPATAKVQGVTGSAGSLLEGTGLMLAYYMGGVVLTSVPMDAGTYTVVASFPGSTDYTTTSATATFEIAKAKTTVAIADSGGTYNGSTFPATATVNGASSLEMVSPTLAYHAGSSASGMQLSGPPKDAGTYTVVASFAGSTDYLASSATAKFVISPVSTTTVVADFGSTIDYGQSETFTATVKAGLIAAVGSVEFYDSTTSTDLGSATLNASGVALFTPSIPLPSGTQSISVIYTPATSPTDFQPSSTSTSIAVVPSVYLLNATASGSLSLSGGSTLTVPGLVQVDSSSSSAIVESNSSKATAQAIRVVGGYSVDSTSGFSTTPVIGTTSVADPLASLSIPAATGFTSYSAVSLTKTSTKTISPGIYPSISVSGSASLTMRPGIYVITGGGFSVTGSASLSGSGVMIYNAGGNYDSGTATNFGSFTLTTTGNVSLTPQATGIYAGIVLFQSRDNNLPLSLTSVAVASLGGGVIYAPAALVSVSPSSQSSSFGQPQSPLIASELQISGGGVSAALAVRGGSSTGKAGGSAGKTAALVVIGSTRGTGQIEARKVTLGVGGSSGNVTPDDTASIPGSGDPSGETAKPRTVEVAKVSGPSPATTVPSTSANSPNGPAASVALGTEPTGAIAILDAWDWYLGIDPDDARLDQYGRETVALDGTLPATAPGLGTSSDPATRAILEPGIVGPAAVADQEGPPSNAESALDAALEDWDSAAVGVAKSVAIDVASRKPTPSPGPSV